MSAPWRRACSACTKSKRQCTKQTPSCRRCTDRGIECEYPPNRRPAAPLEPPTLDIRAPAAPIPEASNNVDYAVSLLAGDIDFDYGLLDFGPPIPSLPDPCAGDTHSQDIPPVPSTPSGPESPAPWFLLPSSWEYEHSLPRCQDDISASSLQAYVDTIRSWFFAWVSGASAPSSPLIHAELYRHDMPRCVQDAYTAVATYRHRTPGSSGTALRILEARARQLAQEQALREGLGELGLPEHLARVHALLAYQALRLFDGDVRARAQADEAADTLFAWCEAMWRCAGRARGRQHRPRASRRGGCPSPPSSSSFSARDADGSGSSSSSNASVPRGADLWHTFIRLESVRRAFITANILQHVYLTMKRGWSDCPGGVTITVRRGIWEAKSAYAWEKLIGQGEKDVLLGLQTMRLDRVLEQMRPVEVDDFGLALIGVHFNEDRLERWFGEKGGGSNAHNFVLPSHS